MSAATPAPCPSCGAAVSPRAFDCPACGHPLRKPRRGVFGVIFKWALIGFNALMVIWLVSYTGDIAELSGQGASDAERAGAAIGGTIGAGIILSFWVAGDIILGLATVLTRPRR